MVIIGGGLDGAATALDAAARGLRTAVIDSGDWAGDVGGPLVPATTPSRPRDAWLQTSWQSPGDDLAGLRVTAPHLLHGRSATDGSLDDARLTLALVRTACLDYGAVAVNRVDMVGVVPAVPPNLRVLTMRDEASGRPFDVSATAWVSAPPRRLGAASPRPHPSSDGVAPVRVGPGDPRTYRRRAARAVDDVLERLDDRTRLRVRRRCPTARMRLRGARGFEEMRDRGGAGGAAFDPLSLAPDVFDLGMWGHIAGRYGGEGRVPLAMIERHPELGRVVVPTLPYLAAELVYGVRYEMASTLGDVLLRRTRAWTLDRAATTAALSEIQAVLVTHAGLDPATLAAQAGALRAGRAGRAA